MSNPPSILDMHTMRESISHLHHQPPTATRRAPAKGRPRASRCREGITGAVGLYCINVKGDTHGAGDSDS